MEKSLEKSKLTKEIEDLLISASEAKRIRNEGIREFELKKLQEIKKEVIKINEFINDLAKNHDFCNVEKLHPEVIRLLKIKGYDVTTKEEEGYYKISWMG